MSDHGPGATHFVQAILSQVQQMIASALTSALAPFTNGSKLKATAIPIGTGLSISGGQIVASGGSGTVTSVGLSLPSSIITVSGSPVTSAGTLDGHVLVNQAANTVWAGPTSGAANPPAFRALVAADLPVATTGAFGAVKPDGSTITSSGGVISVPAGVGIDTDAANIVAINMVQQSSAPTTPASGHRKLFAEADGWYDLDSSGAAAKIGSGSGTRIAMQTGSVAPPVPLWNSAGTDYVYLSIGTP